jgi:hypothetical protein
MKLIIALLSLASVAYGAADTEDYLVDFSPIFEQAVCEFDTVVDGAQVKFLGEMTGVKASASQYGIFSDFVVLVFPKPVKQVGSYIIGPPGARQTCWGWYWYMGKRVYSPHRTNASTRPGLSGHSTPENDEWYFNICTITAPEPTTIYWVAIFPDEYTE